MKFCKKCKTTKDKSLFTKDRRALDGLSTYCKDCHNKNNRELYKSQGQYAKDKYSRNKAEYYRTPKGRYNIYISDVKRKYNKRLTILEFDSLLQQLLLEQQGCCKDCGIDFSLLPEQYHIDHCHDTNVIRDLLCNTCNIRRG